jgi:hypothetical protein
VITVGESVDKFCANSECSDLSQRLYSLESEIRELKSLIFSKESESDVKKLNNQKRLLQAPAFLASQSTLWRNVATDSGN